MQRLKDNAWWTGIVALIVAISSFAVSITQTDDTTTPGKHVRTITFKVDKSGAPGIQSEQVTVPPKVQAQVAPNLESRLRSELPPGVTPEQAQQIQEKADQIKATLPGLPTSGATAGIPGCRTQFISSYSDRHGVRPSDFVLHYTVSPNVPGWADVNSVVHLFANRNNLASSNLVIDGEGHCAYIVPIEFKAWTQAAGNPFSISFEIIDTGKETVYLPAPGVKKLRSVLRVLSKRVGIPLRRGAVHNCLPVKSGIVQHYDFGVCGGGHFDITPFKVDTVVKQLVSGSRPPKKVIWIRHRQQVHVQYQKDCKTRKQRKANDKECRALRVRARTLDTLIRRGSK